MAKEPVKANLFRFVTLRSPQLIEEKAKDPGFVYHPDEESSDFYEAVKNLPDEEKAAALETVSQSFNASAYKTRTELRTALGGLYAFSSWLMRNKNRLTFVEILENSNGVSPLTDAQTQDSEELKIWENLIYQTVNRTSVYIREALIQLLVANKFLKAFNVFAGGVNNDHVFTEDELKEFTRRAYAKVVISKTLFYYSQPEASSKKGIASKVQLKNTESFIAKLSIEQYKKLRYELKNVERIYNEDLSNEYSSALKSHDEDVQDLIDNTVPVIVDIVDELGNITQLKTYPDLKLPEFTFKSKIILDSNYLKHKLSEDSSTVFFEQEFNEYSNISEIYKEIDERIKKSYKTLSTNNINKSKKTVRIGGAKLSLRPLVQVIPYCFSAIKTMFPNGDFGMVMTLSTDYPNATIVDGEFKVKNDSTQEEYIGESIQMMETGNNTLVALFKFDPFLVSTVFGYTFSGSFTMDNSDEYSFSSPSIVDAHAKLVFESCAKYIGSAPPSSPIKDTPIYGVTNLGIADFRRVEQEVCCYVPGEVSHIENIMANEYKERSTRSLISSETTIEETEESERENLKDTTTAERNEMQSEVASVLNEDESQNYGANASVTGNFPKGSFTISGYANFSSASSSSNSNVEALTYAQEVTERAMERILQKVSTKRTSRILKEFEENNKHGFDNTGYTGENEPKHITGVYRWVDKIYKNSLINYGKRLMYEFAIPEPSKFFKQAIYVKNDENILDSEMILPEPPDHPSFYEIDDASDLDEGNYQEIAAYYGAEVNSTPQLNAFVGVSLTKSEAGGDGGRNTNKAPSDFIDVPQGYKAIEAKVAGKTYGGTVSVAVAGRRMALNSEDSLNNGFVPIQPHYLEKVPVSGYFNDTWIANVNIVVKCERTDQFYQQWQNETYDAIMAAYEKRLKEYNDVKQANELVVQPDEYVKLTFNPLYNRSIEKREIKRIAIELLSEQKDHKVSQNNYNPADVNTGIFKVKKDGDLDKHASTVKFFEQAFDWEIMAYIFYPYFYANEGDWISLFRETEAADPIFQAFLQSGMARAVVPVRPGFEDAVNWYMETGEIWMGEGLVVDQDDDLYVSVAEEMQTVEGVVEGTWETRLPTALTIIQAKSALLDEEGLPCFCEEHDEENTIKPSEDVMQPRSSEPVA